LLDLLKERKTLVSPTLAVFDVRRGDKGATDERVRGYPVDEGDVFARRRFAVDRCRIPLSSCALVELVPKTS
jgi:hypothetical protein